MIRLGIIEDNAAITESLVDFFSEDEEIVVVGTADYVDKFTQNVQAPLDVILLDLSLPYKNGMDCIAGLCQSFQGVSIIIHSVSADYESIFKCLCNGAHSYLTKDESLDKIRETILITYSGGSLMSVQIARKVIEHFGKAPQKKTSHEDQRLSNRETEVMNHIIQGKSYKMVADELDISINTVRAYIKSIYKKLNIKTNVELVNIYLK